MVSPPTCFFLRDKALFDRAEFHDGSGDVAVAAVAIVLVMTHEGALVRLSSASFCIRPLISD